MIVRSIGEDGGILGWNGIFTRGYLSGQKMAKDSGYRLLMTPSLNPRQKAFWDKRRKRKLQREAIAKKLKF